MNSIISLLGDISSSNGPGNANKEIKKSLEVYYDVKCSVKESKPMRILEMFKLVVYCDVLVICSASRMNFLAIRIAKLLKKKTVYIMHGYSSYERLIENSCIKDDQLGKIKKYENYVFSTADKVVCVSKRFMDFMIEEQPKYTKKFEYIYNAIDVNSRIRKEEVERLEKKIISVGGGMKQKNNAIIAEVIDSMDDNIEYIVVGKKMSEGEKIRRCKCVTWIDNLPHEELIGLMEECNLYIQNSTFETFGLCVIEALYAGCSILASKNIGCMDLFNSLSDDDVILDVYDREEIQTKISKLLCESNNEKLVSSFDKTQISRAAQAKRLRSIIDSLIYNVSEGDL